MKSPQSNAQRTPRERRGAAVPEVVVLSPLLLGILVFDPFSFVDLRQFLESSISIVVLLGIGAVAWMTLGTARGR